MPETKQNQKLWDVVPGFEGDSNLQSIVAALRR
jgi:hypothetical protein